MPTTTAPTVSLTELAAAIGAPQELAADLAIRAGAEPTLDWKGALVVPAKIATAVLEQRKAEDEAHYRRTVGYQQAHKQWEADRRAVYHEAFTAELARAMKAEKDFMERLHNEGSATLGDSTGQGWAPGGFPLGFRGPSAAAHSKAVEAGRAARAKWDQRHKEPQP
jgi:hypothetical protein